MADQTIQERYAAAKAALELTSHKQRHLDAGYTEEEYTSMVDLAYKDTMGETVLLELESTLAYYLIVDAEDNS